MADSTKKCWCYDDDRPNIIDRPPLDRSTMLAAVNHLCENVTQHIWGSQGHTVSFVFSYVRH